MTALALYGTSCCHLCEQAEAILHEAGLAAEHIDIAEDDELLERYGIRIPVLRRADNDAELGWPFDAEAVADFLK
ncbi:glutaredoxin family protein [Ferrigenium kumadai]|uniref:Glutaredoxin family protein n=1 Tax=Ferrigenium kumadai TaxID=1682490 RepID=A0AAN1T1C3_9PROT|nr:glutaredoxin family protein [Ferrigenium kumadai]BBJ00126.1 glutaredoxin family protein [Ferrigenium kumadai]